MNIENKKWLGDEADDLADKEWSDNGERDYREEQDEERERSDFNDYSDDDIDLIYRD